jgi:drug/metabolite transporter superfamily protein YnfA
MTPTDPDLVQIELLREFKRRMPQKSPAVNISPFDARVSTAAGGPDGGDVADLHSEVRAHVCDTIVAVREGKKQSQVILLSGAAGVGKTHLLRTFRSAESMAAYGHIFVGGSNHWTIGEFERRVLDWVLEALTAPSPAEPHPLLDRIQAIGFRAVDHLLENRVAWKAATARGGRGVGRWFGWLKRRPGFDAMKAMAAARNPEVFAHLDFAAFSKYVCDRFLAERSNLLHRYALRVLLLYLFPDALPEGVGTRERVLHWFRGVGDEAYFTRRLGANEKPDRTYSQFEAVKLLAHLFSPAVSTQLSTAAAPCPSRVLFLTFDQAEGRNELFDAEDDWRAFFAHLSELYNSLPNVVVLFTMTETLRGKLHGVMERQFKDRIRMDRKVTLDLPNAEQVKRLYRRRVESWLAGDMDLKAKYSAAPNPYLPFASDAAMLKVAGNQAVRGMFEDLDREFIDLLGDISVDAEIDYQYDRNQRKAAEQDDTEWNYTAGHLDTVRNLLIAVGPLLTSDTGLEVREMHLMKLDTVPVIRFRFGRPGQSAALTVHVARLGKHYREPIKSLVDGFLYNQTKAKSFLWFVRPQPLPDLKTLVDKAYSEQVFAGECGVDVESAFASLLVVDANRVKYDDAGRLALDALVRREVGRTYLGEMFRHARKQLDAIAGGVAEPDLEPTPA